MFQPIKKDEVHWYFSPLVFFGGSFLGSLFCFVCWFGFWGEFYYCFWFTWLNVVSILRFTLGNGSQG